MVRSLQLLPFTFFRPPAHPATIALHIPACIYSCSARSCNVFLAFLSLPSAHRRRRVEHEGESTRPALHHSVLRVESGSWVSLLIHRCARPRLVAPVADTFVVSISRVSGVCCCCCCWGNAVWHRLLFRFMFGLSTPRTRHRPIFSVPAGV